MSVYFCSSDFLTTILHLIVQSLEPVNHVNVPSDIQYRISMLKIAQARFIFH